MFGDCGFFFFNLMCWFWGFNLSIKLIVLLELLIVGKVKYLEGNLEQPIFILLLGHKFLGIFVSDNFEVIFAWDNFLLTKLDVLR